MQEHQRPAPPAGVSEQLWDLHLRASRGDGEARGELLAEYAPLAHRHAAQAHRGGEPLDDLVQVALEALLRAIDRYDPCRGIPFVAFATPTISGSLKRYYRDCGWAVRVPRPVHDLAPAVRRGSDLLSQDLGRAPTAGEVADLLGVPPQDVEATLAATAVRAVRSIEEPGVGDRLGRASSELGRAEDRVELQRAVGTLEPDARLALVRYYGDERTQSEIARELGCSQVHVSRLLARSISRLRSRAP